MRSVPTRSCALITRENSGGTVRTRVSDVKIPVEAVRGRFERLSNLQLRELVTDLSLELERRDPASALLARVRERLMASKSWHRPEPITSPPAMGDPDSGRAHIRPARRQVINYGRTA